MESDDIRICFVGDSFVNGTGDPEYLGWVGRVCALAARAGYQVTAYNLGVRRNTSADIAARWLTECQQRLPPQYDCRVVFSFGVNDTVIEDGVRRLSSAATREHARRILSQAREQFATLMIGPPPVAEAEHNQRIAEIDAILQEVAGSCNVAYCSVFDTLHQSPTWMDEVARYDGSHPQAAGYTEMATTVQHWSAWWFNRAIR